MRFQHGDIRVQINGRPVTLRLTLGALAEICERLSAPSPKALSQRLRTLTAAQARVLLACLSCPSLHDKDAPADAVASADIAALLPDICRVFERAFAAPNSASPESS